MARVAAWSGRIWKRLGSPVWPVVILALCIVAAFAGYRVSLSWQRGLSFEPAHVMLPPNDTK
jgi:hypothetical protein